ncbi:hypothetical protein PV433_10910 [Paenibacillus sp. GYB004]|uniref:hypothetical protein n=1 Tax=Paenibacillus sp. GYB004 TaxID=2994393 RepID=UPI002F96250D
MSYIGYRFVQNESQYYYEQGIELTDEQSVWDFIKENKAKYAMIRIIEKEDDVICVEAVDGRITFPLQWSIMELAREYDGAPSQFTPLGFIEELHIRGLDKRLIGMPFNVAQALEQLKRIYASIM